MSDESMDLSELRETAAAVAALAKDPEAFKMAAEAAAAVDTARFEAALNRVGLVDRCPLICRFFCTKRCLGICQGFCPEPGREADVGEMLAFAVALDGLMADEKAVEMLLAAMAANDVKAWNEALKRLKLGKFCHQLCRFLCSVRCKRVCRQLCPPKPLITRVGSIPVDQISGLGFGNGEGVPPFHVGVPNFTTTGNHPFGASVWLMGVFNFPGATQYLVEVAPAPGGPYTPIDGVPVPGYNPNAFPPPTNINLPAPGRVPVPMSGGWYDIADIPSSDGGPVGNNEKTLMYWPSTTVPDGVNYLRLQVRDGALTRVSSPQMVVIDNSGPFPLPRPTISLELQKADGTLEPLKCGTVRKGDGLIRVTIHAFDPNLSSVSVTARGNSGLSVPVEGIPAALFPGGAVVPLSKSYNGNLAEQGYPVPTSFVWNPFDDPRYVPCCYLVYIEINDRAILNDTYAGGHSNAGWEAIEIGF